MLIIELVDLLQSAGDENSLESVRLDSHVGLVFIRCEVSMQIGIRQRVRIGPEIIAVQASVVKIQHKTSRHSRSYCNVIFTALAASRSLPVFKLTGYVLTSSEMLSKSQIGPQSLATNDTNTFNKLSLNINDNIFRKTRRVRIDLIIQQRELGPGGWRSTNRRRGSRNTRGDQFPRRHGPNATRDEQRLTELARSLSSLQCALDEQVYQLRAANIPTAGHVWPSEVKLVLQTLILQYHGREATMVGFHDDESERESVSPTLAALQPVGRGHLSAEGSPLLPRRD
ncbi:hypothetical protein J6590_004216 [Homalodisca vitripennis]|nr:hypothetical protein J6590_004216 [Homalodisca vitripennis]